MEIRVVCDLLKRCGLVHSHAEFSRDYLGRSSRYLDYLICSGAEPSVEVLTSLAVRLRRVAMAAQAASAPVVQTDALLDLRVQVWAEIERRTMVALPRSRRVPGRGGGESAVTIKLLPNLDIPT